MTNALPENNLLIAGLPRTEYDRIRPHLEPTRLAAGRTLLPPGGDTLDRFYFISDGLVSHLYRSADGLSAEISLVGPEGGIGLPLILGGRPLPAEAVVQAEGYAWSLAREHLQREFDRGETLQRNLLRFTHALITQISQTVICARYHSLELQLCRWMLLTHERLGSNELEMTHDMIAQMLGVRRAGVSESVGRLRAAGLIEHRRGQIRITDPDGLRARACDCYRVVSEEDALLRAEMLGGDARRGSAPGC